MSSDRVGQLSFLLQKQSPLLSIADGSGGEIKPKLITKNKLKTNHSLRLCLASVPPCAKEHDDGCERCPAGQSADGDEASLALGELGLDGSHDGHGVASEQGVGARLVDDAVTPAGALPVDLLGEVDGIALHQSVDVDAVMEQYAVTAHARDGVGVRDVLGADLGDGHVLRLA